jgi:ABC-type polysaccharide/polyol phosphate export permease
VLQGAVMAVVFSRVVRISSDAGFAAYVMSGIVAWAYFSGTLSTASTSIVDGAGLTDKVWFPRLLLVLVPAISGLVGLVVSMLVLLALAPVVHVTLGLNLLLLAPACVLLVSFTLALSLVLSALHVYFRDVKFIVQAAMLVWLYLTPIAYPKSLLGSIGPWVDLNPMTGVVAVFHRAVGQTDPSGRAIVISVVMTAILLVVGLAAHRFYDRLFVDKL